MHAHRANDTAQHSMEEAAKRIPPQDVPYFATQGLVEAYDKYNPRDCLQKLTIMAKAAGRTTHLLGSSWLCERRPFSLREKPADSWPLSHGLTSAKRRVWVCCCHFCDPLPGPIPSPAATLS